MKSNTPLYGKKKGLNLFCLPNTGLEAGSMLFCGMTSAGTFLN